MRIMKLRNSRICLPSRPMMWGIGSLGNISGGYVSFDRYMKGNDVEAMKNDWRRVGADMRITFSKGRK